MLKSVRVSGILAVLVAVTSCQVTVGVGGSPSPEPASPSAAGATALGTTESDTERTPGALPSPTSDGVVGAAQTPVYDIPSVRLPDECYGSLPAGTPTMGDFEQCSDFAYSADGKYLGFFFGPEICGRGILILDTQTANTVYRTGAGGGFSFEFLTNGRVLIAAGHCEGGAMSLLDPRTGELRRLGDLGIGAANNVWNATRTALAVSTTPYRGAEGAIWGYNVEEDFLFLPQPEKWQLDDHLVWTPDGTHLLYQHRVVSYAVGTNIYTFPSPRQIVRVDAATGEHRVLAGDPRYDFHFCAGPYSWCDHWHGDWIQVRRFPFEPRQILYSDDFYYLPEATCLLYGIDCAEPPELSALNWRTGELVPWDEAALPTPIPVTKPTESPPAG